MRILRRLFARRLRWQQFSLRSVMIVMLLGSVYLVIISSRHRTEQAGIRTIESQGGDVYDTLSSRFDGVDCSMEYVEEEYVEEVEPIDQVGLLYDLATRYLNDPKAFSRGQLSREIQEITDSIEFREALASDGVEPTIDGPYGNGCSRLISRSFPYWTEGVRKLFEGDQPEGQAVAARLLWRLRSLHYADDILDWAEKAKRSSSGPNAATINSIVREILDSAKPKAIARDIIRGNKTWGFHLAALRPHHTLTPVLVRQLKSPYESQGVYALGQSDDRRALDKLFEVLHTGNSDTSESAGEAIVKIAGRSARARLMATLAADHNRVSTLAAAQALKKISVLESPSSSDETATTNSDATIRLANERRALDLLFEMLHAGLAKDSQLAADTIVAIASRSAGPRLMATIGADHNRRSTLAAAKALLTIGTGELPLSFCEIATREGEEATYRANERRAIDSLFKIMHLGFEDKSRLAVYTILQIAGDSSEPRFLATLAGGHNYVAKQSAIEALGKIGRLTSVEALQEIAGGGDDSFADILADAAGQAIEQITLRQAELHP